MKIFKFLLFFLVVAFAGCKTEPRPVAPIPRDNNNPWCQYLITAQTAGCGNNRVGKTVCILCSEDFAKNQLCPGRDEPLVITPAEGCELTLKPLAQGQQQCENCTAESGATYRQSSRPGVP